MFSTPQGAAILLLITVIGLFAIKVIVGLATGSISIWAQAVDSSLDIFAVIVTFLTVGFSAKPADEEHPFGHGKIEDIAAGIQAILLLAASAAVAISAVGRIRFGGQIKLEEAGIAVMAVSLITSIFLSRYLFKVAKATGSVALEANANNIRGDVYSTSGVMLGLALVKITGWTIIDPVIALAVVFLILRATYRVARMATGGLLDVRLPKSEEDTIVSAIMEHTGQLAGFHEMRTRKAGSQRFIDLHLMLPKNISVEEAHGMCDHLEEDLREKLANISITIHVEPCDSTECEPCQVSNCNARVNVVTQPRTDKKKSNR